jgi:hypothetical protein
MINRLRRLLRILLIVVLLIPLSGCLALLALNGAGTVVYYNLPKKDRPSLHVGK